MILPSDDSIVIDPSDDGPLVIDSSNPPAPNLADTQALLPGWARSGTSAVRDAWLAAWGAVANTIWARTSFTLEAQQSPRFAEGTQLDEWGTRKQLPRTAGETDAAFRARLLFAQDVVSPNAIAAAYNAALAPYAATAAIPSSHPALAPDFTATYIEPATDALFVGSTTAPWQAFVQSSTQRLWANYPDRPIGTKVGAYVVEAIGGQGGTVKTPGIGRFWIVLPFDAGGDPASAPCCQATTYPVEPPQSVQNYPYPVGALTTTPAIFATLETDYLSAAGAAMMFGYLLPATQPLIEKVAQAVEPIRGGGVQWLCFVDPLKAFAL